MSDDELFPKPSSSDSHSDLVSSQLQDGSWSKSKSCYRIPRPPNAFMIFANEWRRKLAYQHPSMFATVFKERVYFSYYS